MRDGNGKPQCGGKSNAGSEKTRQDKGKEIKKKGRRKKAAAVLLLILILILIILCFRSCRARDEPLPDETGRIYEEDRRREDDGPVSAGDEKRLNLAVAECYRITDEKPYFYIGFPEDNVYDVVFVLKDADGNELYRTNYVAPGTSVAIDGTAFLSKGEQKVDCLVSIYGHDSGALVSDCTTVVLNVNYQ